MGKSFVSSFLTHGVVYGENCYNFSQQNVLKSWTDETANSFRQAHLYFIWTYHLPPTSDGYGMQRNNIISWWDISFDIVRTRYDDRRPSVIYQYSSAI